MRSFTWTLPLALLTPLVPGQSSPDAAPGAESNPAPQCTAPAFAPLPADPSLAPQWHSLTLPESDPTAPQKRGPAAPAPPIDPLFDPSPLGIAPLHPRAHGVVDPFAVMQRQIEAIERFQAEVQRQLDQQIQTHMGQSVQMHGFTSRASGLEDRGDHYAIEMEIAGLNCSTPNLRLSGNLLTLNCRQTQEVMETTPEGETRCRARFTNNIRQSWTLPPDADREEIDATVDGERVTITIAKSDDTVEIPLTTWGGDLN